MLKHVNQFSSEPRGRRL